MGVIIILCHWTIEIESIIITFTPAFTRTKGKGQSSAAVQPSSSSTALPKTFEVAVRSEATALSDILGTTVEGAEKKAEFCKFRGLGEGSETL